MIKPSRSLQLVDLALQICSGILIHELRCRSLARCSDLRFLIHLLAQGPAAGGLNQFHCSQGDEVFDSLCRLGWFGFRLHIAISFALLRLTLIIFSVKFV